MTQQTIYTILAINTFLQHTDRKLSITRDNKQYDIFTVDLMGRAYSMDLDEKGVALTDEDFHALVKQMHA